ncbi:MAG: hypothetical protein U0R64_09885 [Candidatus Nanopelagicales bacterium]
MNRRWAFVTLGTIGALTLTLAPQASAATTWDPVRTIVGPGTPALVNGLAASRMTAGGRSVVAYTVMEPTPRLYVTVGRGTRFPAGRLLSSGEAGNPAVAISASGRKALVGWSQYEADTTTTIRAAWYRHGAWSRSRVLARSAPGDTLYGPNFAANDSLTRGVVAWQLPRGDHGMYFRRWKGTRFAAATRLNRAGGYLGAPDVAITGTTLTFALSRGRTGSQTVEVVQVNGNRRRSTVLGRGFGIASIPELATSADGTAALASWTVYTGTDPRVYGASRRNGTWSSAQALGPTGSAHPLVDLSADGRQGLLSWTRGTHDIPNLLEARRQVKGRWGSTTVLSREATRSGQSQSLSASGRRATVLWSTYTGFVASGARSLTGRTWGPATVPGGDRPGQGFSALSASADGTRLTAWWTVLWNPGDPVVRVGLQRASGGS